MEPEPDILRVRVIPGMPIDLVFDTSKVKITASIDEFGEIRLKTDQSIALLPVAKDEFAIISAFDFDRDYNLNPAWSKPKEEPKRRKFKTKKDKSLPEKDASPRKVDPAWAKARQHLRGLPREEDANDDPFMDT